ncbi:transposase [Streptomyces sp. NBC_01077]|uniref:IS701 family transposase n=1 Tax=Streptomyces sp. NBC_01077 TaxID=2903746 RepID=UPI00386A05D5|nr:transposase [Streptomyces sp. NBC_01077]WSV43753.1 transposase [Streptomyces sp. NBC_01077]
MAATESRTGFDTLAGSSASLPTQRVRQEDFALRQLTAVLFKSLDRSDQRRHALAYLRGLLGADGRRSIRNIAALHGDPTMAQSLHHFISNSTWEWSPMREALAEYLVGSLQPAAWVTVPLAIPKRGTTSVGSERQYVPELGQVAIAQQAVGVWASTEDVSSPVNWRLRLPEKWLEDPERRRQASIPDDLTARTLEECAVEAALETASGWGLPVRPVVIDARRIDVASLVKRFHDAGVPFVARISDNTPLAAAEPGPANRTGAFQPAGQMVKGWSGCIRPVRRPQPREPETHPELAATVQVRIRQVTGPADLTLLATGQSRREWPAELWLTNITNAHMCALVQLTKLPERIDQECGEAADRLGIRDFRGRSYEGWNRHVTLVSAAYALSMFLFKDCRIQAGHFSSSTRNFGSPQTRAA